MRAIPLALLLAGCAPQLFPEMSRFDGKTIDPVALEQAKVECASRGQVAQAAVPQHYGQYGGYARSIEQQNTNNAAFTGCMAEKGMRVTWREVQPSSGGPPPQSQPPVVATGSIPPRP